MTADLALIWPELILTIGGLITLMLGTFFGDRAVGLYQLAAMLTLAIAAAAVKDSSFCFVAYTTIR